MNIYSYPPIISALLFLSLGIFIVFKAGKRYFISIPFALICIATLCWQGTWAILFNVKNKELALFLVKFGYSGIIFIPFAFYHFIVSWVEIKREKIVVFLFYIIGLIFLYFLWSSDYFISGFYEYFWGYYPKAGILHPLYLLFLSISASRIFIILALSLKKKNLKPIERNQIKYVLAAIAIYTFAASDFLINYGIGFYPPGVVFILASLFLLTYAIMYYKFMDINIFYRKVLSDMLLFLTIGISFFFITLILEKILFDLVDSRFIVLNFFVIFFGDLFAYFFHKFKSLTEKIIEKALFKDKYDYLESIVELGQKIITYLDLDQLLITVVNSLIKSLNLEDIAIYLFDEESSEYWLAKDFNPKYIKNPRFLMFDPYISFLQGRKNIIVWEEEKNVILDTAKEFAKKMHEFNAAVTIPLVLKGHLIGIIQLGDKKTKQMYSHEDLELLKRLSEKITAALINAMEYNAIGKLYAIRNRQEKITSLSELAAGLSHQIRNRIVAMKNLLYAVSNNYDQGTLFGMAKLAECDLEGLVNIIDEFQEFSNAGLNPAFYKVDINKFIKNTILKICSKVKGIEIITDLESRIPDILSDESELEKTFSVIFENAVEAMENRKDKKIIVKTSQIAKKSVKDNKWEKYVQISISDSGEGLSERDLKKIFNPLHTTKSQRIGLNLAIVHRTVDGLGGFAEVESKTGKGASFLINLPLDYKPSQKRTAEEIKAKKEGEDVYRGGEISEAKINLKEEQEDIKKLLEEHRKNRGV